METLLNTQELAQRLNVPAGTVRRWRDAGTGPPAVRVGRQIRYRPSAVEAWLDSRSTTGGAAA